MDEEVRRGNRGDDEAAVALGRLQERVASLERWLSGAQAQNQRDEERRRSDVHALRNEMQDMTDKFSEKLEEVRLVLASSKGERDYKQWIFPVLITVGLVIIGVLDLLKK